MTIPCPSYSDCGPCNDEPSFNLSSEALDNPQLTAQVGVPTNPLLGETFEQTSGNGVGGQNLPVPVPVGGQTNPEGTNGPTPTTPPSDSQIDGTTNGTIDSLNGNTDHRGDPVNVYRNHAQHVSVDCPFSTGTYYWTFDAGQIAARSQAEADAVAHSLALQQAQTQAACMDKISFYGCYNQPLNGGGDEGFDMSSGTPPFGGELYGGSLPDGCWWDTTPDPNDPNLVGFVRGTPTATGSGMFILKVTDTFGGYLLHPVRWFVLGILTGPDLPPTTANVPYSVQLTADGWQDDFTFSLVPPPPDPNDPHLPFLPGIYLSPSGLIAGTTPSEFESNFIVHVETPLSTTPGDVWSCDYPFTINGHHY